MKREKWEGPWWRKYVLYIIASAMQPPSLSRPIANVSPSLNGDPSSNVLSWITMENNGEKDIFCPYILGRANKCPQYRVTGEKCIFCP